MEGRRINRPSPRTNPLFLLFCCLVAATAVLLIVSIVLGIRLGIANKKLSAAEEKVAALTESVETLQDQLAAAEHGSSARDDIGSLSPSGSAIAELPGSAAQPPSPSASSGSWLDLSGHSEVSVKPTNLLEGYATYYTTAGVNLRSGPATSYERIDTVELGTKVDVAAREGNWSFVRAEGKYGWINSDYLSTSEPSVQASASSTRNSGSGSSSGSSSRTGTGSSGSRSEATSGSLKKR